MSRFYSAIALAGILSLGATAFAQDRDDHDRDRDRERAGRYDAPSVAALVDRVHDDLNRASRAVRFSNSDRGRLNDAEKKLREFSQKWNRHDFDKDRLDNAIAGLQHVLDNNKLPDRERAALTDDVGQLRGMREAYDRHEIN